MAVHGTGPIRSIPIHLILILFGFAGAVEASPARSFAECEARFRSQPENYEAAYCFYEVARQDGGWDKTSHRLEALLRDHPDNHWLRLTLGHVFRRLEPSRTEATYRAAAEGFRRRSIEAGEVLARTNLYSFLVRQGDLERAGAEVDRVAEIAAAADDPIVMARSLDLEANHLRNLGRDLEAAYRLLRQAETLIFPSGPYRLQRACLNALGSVCYRLGRYSDAMSYYQRLEKLAQDRGDHYTAALFKYNQANTLQAEQFELPTSDGREKLLLMYRDALDAATAAGHLMAEVHSRRGLADLLSRDEESRQEARRHYEHGIETAQKLSQPRLLADSMWALGGHLAHWGELEAARALLDESLALARDAEDFDGVARVSDQRMRVSWAEGPGSAALAAARAALDAVEALRDRQTAASGRADLFAAWSDVYYWPAGRLLDSDPPRRQNVEIAFSFAERLRARVLLEALADAQAHQEGQDHAAPTPVQASLVQVQRQLLDTGLEDTERRRILRELDRLEMDEAAAKQASPLAKADFATLAEVEEALAEDEALLSFQIALWQDIYGDFGGGSWLLASTRQGTRVYRLPDRVVLRPAIRRFTGLFEKRDGSEINAAGRLYQDLLATALADLPSTVQRLVIVPDGDLHRLPFAALRPTADAAPLALNYELSRSPSATVWLRWRRAAAERPGRAVLALADPRPAAAGEQDDDAASDRRDWALASGARLGVLLHARAEGRAAVRHLGGRSRLLLGAQATEHHLKTTALKPYGVLHFAAHAVVDDERPQRSAVVLAPGSPDEDGLLQPRDIAGLELAGRVVVLSACQSASGAVLRGEGVLSLARAFFEAGAGAVVGSLWPLRDRDAAALFDRFYHHLATGESVAGALAAAQADRVRDGAPADAWAGVVILGDGGTVPLPGGRTRPMKLLVPLGVLLAAAVLAWYRRHKSMTAVI